MIAAIGLLVVFAGGCEDEDPAAEMRAAFEEMKASANRADEFLASIDSKEKALLLRAEIEENLKKMTCCL